MGLFRPARTVTGPTGTWELYVSKTALPAWKEGQTATDFESSLAASGEGFLIAAALSLVSVLWTNLIVPLGRFLVFLPISFVRGKRSRAIRIEALNPFPQREVLLWTTTVDAKERVLDEIADGLAAGKIVHPVGAVYSGREVE
jgi:hypothetical protein